MELIEAVGRNEYTARLSIAQKGQVDALPFVSATRLFQQEGIAPETLSQRSAETPADSTIPALTVYELRLHRAEDGDDVVQRLETQGIQVDGSQGRKIRFYLRRDQQDLEQQIRGLPEVYSVQVWIKLKLTNDRARILLGVDHPTGHNPTTRIRQTGAGQIVAIADTGIDQTHPDFDPARIVGVIARGRPPGDATDPHGHGTHVAGSLLGDGTASNGAIRGTAPGASLFFQSVLDSHGDLGGLPWNLNDLFLDIRSIPSRRMSSSRITRTCSSSSPPATRARPDPMQSEHRRRTPVRTEVVRQPGSSRVVRFARSG